MSPAGDPNRTVIRSTAAQVGIQIRNRADPCPDDPDDDARPADLASGLPTPDDGYGKHDGTVNILDMVQLTPPVFNQSCT